MNAVLDEKYVDVQDMEQEKYEYIPHEEVVKLSRMMIEKHREAYMALANA